MFSWWTRLSRAALDSPSSRSSSSSSAGAAAAAAAGGPSSSPLDSSPLCTPTKRRLSTAAGEGGGGGRRRAARRTMTLRQSSPPAAHTARPVRARMLAGSPWRSPLNAAITGAGLEFTTHGLILLHRGRRLLLLHVCVGAVQYVGDGVCRCVNKTPNRTVRSSGAVEAALSAATSIVR